MAIGQGKTPLLCVGKQLVAARDAMRRQRARNPLAAEKL
jgi:hypothetical protein